MSPYAVYHHFRRDVLLYVGSTKDPFGRTKQHDKDSIWFSFVTHTTYHYQYDYNITRVIEINHIKTKKPLFNKQHNDDLTLRRYIAQRLTKTDDEMTIWAPINTNWPDDINSVDHMRSYAESIAEYNQPHIDRLVSLFCQWQARGVK
jgi:hypothetical protein